MLRSFGSTASALPLATPPCKSKPREVVCHLLKTLTSLGRLQASIGNGPDARERRRKLAETLPMKRITAPTDIANAAWFLASDQSSFMTGTTIEVDGGRGV